MRIALRDPLAWRSKLALRPRIVCGHLIWLERYEYREAPYSEGERGLPPRMSVHVQRRLMGNALIATYTRLFGWT